MKKILAMTAAAVLAVSCAAAENVDNPVIGGADGATSIVLKNETSMISLPAEACKDTATVTLDANPTTGYSWKAFVLGGESVILPDENGEYNPDFASEGVTGAGGQTQFTLQAVAEGQSLVNFVYARPWEGRSEVEYYVLATVDADNNIYLDNVTEFCRVNGTVVENNEAEHTTLIHNDQQGDVLVHMPEEMPLPILGNVVTVYTNGIMTMSLPAQVSCLAWEYVVSDLARGEDIQLPEGRYLDDYSMRAYADVKPLGDNRYDIEIHWADSAFEDNVWTMTATMQPDRTMTYDNCVAKKVVTAEDGTQTETVKNLDPNGFFVAGDDLFGWFGAAEEDCRECNFVFFESVDEEE
ncbi:MAG: protease inhibitor I42 family protein [Clostridia bacterium]|nr:protease inhibitor I42 family protein [Clostridia bacterium]